VAERNDPVAKTLEDIADELCDASGGDEVRIEEIVASFGRRSYGPLLLFPALIAVMPVIGALPGVTWSMAGLATLISFQFAINRERLWLPGPVAEASLPRHKLNRALERARPWFRRVDALFRPRLEIMLRPALSWVIALVCLALSLAMFPFSLIPGGVMAPGLALALLAFGLTAHDGLFLAIGLAASAGVLGFLAWALP